MKPIVPYLLAFLFLIACDVAFLSPAIFTSDVRAPADVTPHWPPFSADRETPPPAPRNQLLNDWLVQFHPWQHLVRDAWLAGRPPLWNSQSGCGEPLLANMQCGALSPYLPIVLLAGDQACDWQQLAQLVVSQLFCLLLAAHLGLSAAAGAVVAIAFGFSSFMQPWALHPHAASASFAPGILWAMLRLVAAPSAWRLLIAAACVAFSILAGHLETATKFTLAAATVVLLHAIIQRPPCGRWRAAGLVAGAALCGLLLSACGLLPFLDYVSQSDIRDVRADYAAQQIPSSHLMTLLDPDAFGTPLEPATMGPDALYPDGVLHVGLGALLLAAVGLLGGLRRHAAMIVPLLAVAAAGILVASGPEGIRLFWAKIPVLSDIRPRRCFTLGILPLAVFAGIGLDTVSEVLARTSSRVRALAAIAGVALCALTSALPWRGFLPTAPLSDLHPPSRALEALRQRASSGRALDLARILPGGFGELYGFPRLKRYDAIGLRRFSEVFAAEKTFPVFPEHAQTTFAPSAILDALSVRWILSTYPASEARLPSKPFPIEPPGVTVELARFLHAGRAPEIVVFRGYGQQLRDGTIDLALRGPDLECHWTLGAAGWTAAGCEPPAAADSAAVAEFLATQLSRFQCEAFAIPEGLAARTRTVTFGFARPSAQYWVAALSPGGVGGDLAEVVNFGWHLVTERKSALDFAYFAADFVGVSGARGAAELVRADDFDPHAKSVIELPLGGIPALGRVVPPPSPLQPGESAAVRSREPGRIEVQVRAAVPRILVVTEALARGWEASIDSQDAPVFGVNAITMGCTVQPGDHTVVFRYVPASFPAGCAISAATLLGLGLATVRRRSRRRPAGAQSVSSRSEDRLLGPAGGPQPAA